MTRPSPRALPVLPELTADRRALETCAFCPKLCRGACPVSNAEPSEALIPWGKMSATYAMASGDLAHGGAAATTAWACTGCLACRDACDHQNPVATTLLRARAAHHHRGMSPDAARRVLERLPDRDREAQAAAQRLGGARESGAALLVGCLTLRKAPAIASATLAVATAVLGEAPAVLTQCCGYAAAAAGDRDGFLRRLGALEEAVAGRPLFVADAGCAYALTELAPALGGRRFDAQLLLDRAASRLAVFQEGAVAGPHGYHDPCLLARGMGRVREPRALIAHVTGEAAEEAADAGAAAHCSGAGGLLPATHERIATRIGATRATELAPGPVVTACAASRLSLRRAGRDVIDLFELAARALPPGGGSA